MAHDEFPPLTAEADKVLSAGIKATVSADNPGGIHAQRIFAAAVIRESVRQAGPFTVGTGLNGEVLEDGEVVEVVALKRIADGLHALPPPPPTREQMEEALQSLVGRLDFHPESQFAQEAAILAAGIAHHCKVQP
jgi:hypothetical protein